MAFTAFLFLIEQEAMKMEGTDPEKGLFDKRLQDIERYLTDGDWALASTIAKRFMRDYDDFIKRHWIKKKEITVKEAKDMEKKVDAEEIKNVEQNND